MLKDVCSRRLITTCLPDHVATRRRFTRHRKLRQRVETGLQQIAAQLSPSLIEGGHWQHYPWCFVMPDSEARRPHFFVGAFIPTGTSPVVAVYTRISDNTLLRQLATMDNIVFWLSRVIAPLSDGGSEPQQLSDVRQQCRILQRAESSFRRPTETVRALKELLGTARCAVDNMWEEKHGVEAMPWKKWPGCIQHVETIWLWRQSRQGKVIEAQKIMSLNHIINE